MKFKCCDFLLHEIVFAQSEVIPCCCSPNHNYDAKFISNFDGSNFDVDKYVETKLLYIEMLKQDKIPKCCEGCSNIKEKEWNDISSIKRIIITNRTKCSCNCIYCSLVTTSNQTKEFLNSRQSYNIIPVLKDLRNKNLIDKNCEILIAGGECSEYPDGELEEIIYFASSLDCKIEILSSGIRYSETIEKSLISEKCTLKISVDSGTKKTYETIKRVKAYNQVWTNLEKYISATKKNNQAFVKIKYILIPGINDNIKEFISFIDKCKKIGCKYIELAIEYIWFSQNKHKKPPTSFKEIVNYLKKSEMEISFEMQCFDYLNN